MKLHKTITRKRVEEACRRRSRSLDNPGFCVNCGHEAEGVEPDAEGYECEACGAAAVFGAEELLVHYLAAKH